MSLVPKVRLLAVVSFVLFPLSPLLLGQNSSNDPTNLQIDTGIHSLETYDGVHDSVSVGTGNLSFCIPLVHISGIANHDINIPLCYNSQFEEFSGQATVPGMYPVLSWFPWVWDSKTPAMGPGWTLTGRPGIYSDPNVQGEVAFMPDGGRYTFPYTTSTGSPANEGPDFDGENLYLTSNGQWLYQGDGTKTTGYVTNTTQEYKPDGSLITYTPSSITDTLGRTVSVSETGDGSGTQSTLSFGYLDSNGNQQTVTVQFAAETFSCYSTPPGPSNAYGINGTYSMPTAVILPNGSTYTFLYTSCGEISKISYPSGGYTRYGYSLVSTAWYGQTINENQVQQNAYELSEVTAKYVCSSASGQIGATTGTPGDTCSVPEEMTTYQPNTNGPGSYGTNSGNTVTDPLGNYVVYSFSGSTPWEYIPSLETERQYYNKAGASLKTVLKTYYPQNYNGDSLNPILPMSQTTILNNGESSEIQWTYDIQPLGNSTIGNSPLLEKREYGYDGNLMRRTDYDWLNLDYPAVYGSPGDGGINMYGKETSEIVYDGAGNMLSKMTKQYDDGNYGGGIHLGLVTQVSKWLNTTNTTLTTSYIWSLGGISQITDPNGDVTKYDYTDKFADGPGNTTTGAYPTTVTRYTGPGTNGTQIVEHRQYYWGSGLVAADCGANFSGTCETGGTSGSDYTSYTYDSMGRQVLKTTGDGGSLQTCYSDSVGLPCSSNSYPLSITSTEVINSGKSKVSIATLDGLGRIVHTQTSPGIFTDTTYDLDERLSTKSNPYYSLDDPTYNLTTYIYDGLSRVTGVQDMDGTLSTNTYVGSDVLTADGGNGTATVQSISEKDAFGRLTGVCEISGTTQMGSANNTPSSCGLHMAGTGFVTNYTYDALGNLLGVSQGGENRSFSYDSLSRLLTATNPESGTTQYGYDLDGNLTSKTTAAEITTTYAYDGLNRLLSKTYSDGATPWACYAYDQQTTTNGQGRLTSEWTLSPGGSCSTGTSGSGVLTQRTFAAYDLMGRVAADEQCSVIGNCASASPYVVNYGYDVAGDMTSFNNGLSGSSAMSFANSYDSGQRLLTMAGPTTVGSENSTNLFTAADENGYTAAGELTNAQIGPGITFGRAYNNRLLPTSETDTTNTTPGSATIQITGGEQESGATTGSITFSGTELQKQSDGQTIYDTGLFLVYIGSSSQPYQLSYNQNSSAMSLANQLQLDMTCASGGVTAHVTSTSISSNATVNLASCTSGTGTDYTINAFFDGNNGQNFPTPSFSVTQSGPTMVIPPATYATGTITVAGSNPNNDFGVLEIFPWPGNAEDGPVSVGFESNNTASVLESEMESQFATCRITGQYFRGTINGPVISLTSCTEGAVGNSYPIQVSGSAGGITMVTSGSTLSGGLPGGATYDTGTVSLTVNGTVVASTSYGPGSLPSTIAEALADASAGNGIVTVTNPSGPSLKITALDGGSDSDFSYQLTSSTSLPAVFSSPSFSASSTSGDLEGGQNVPLYNWAITNYAPDGDILGVTDSVMGTWAYAYDDLNRLTSGVQQNGLDLTWDYDRYGNRWNQNASGSGGAVQTSFTFSGNNNRIDQYSGNYDADGNLLSDSDQSYAYDAENRIISINGQPTYMYDAEGNRVAKYTSGTLSTAYILGLGGQEITELNGSGQWIYSNVYTPGGRLLATYEGSLGPDATGYHYHLTDWLGTERVETNSSGVADSPCQSNPFGDGLSCSGTEASEQHFTGKDRDPESGLDYFGARYYSSNFGRFMTPDWAAAPASVPYANFGNPQSLNLYEYAGNNPNTFIDVDGHDPGDDEEELEQQAQDAEDAAGADLGSADYGIDPDAVDDPPVTGGTTPSCTKGKCTSTQSVTVTADPIGPPIQAIWAMEDAGVPTNLFDKASDFITTYVPGYQQLLAALRSYENRKTHAQLAQFRLDMWKAYERCYGARCGDISGEIAANLLWADKQDAKMGFSVAADAVSILEGISPADGTSMENAVGQGIQAGEGALGNAAQ